MNLNFSFTATKHKFTLLVCFLRVSSAFTTTATSTKPVNNSTIMIRLAVRSDTSRIARINIANLPENYPPDFYRHHLSTWPQHALVAEECYSLPEGGRRGGITRRKLVGYALGRVYEEPGDVVKVRNRMQLMGIHQPSTICHITSLAVVPEQRRSGVAQSLVFQLHQQMRRCHRNCYVNLHVRQSNTAAIRLYMEHMGYKIVDYIPNYYEVRFYTIVHTLGCVPSSLLIITPPSHRPIGW